MNEAEASPLPRLLEVKEDLIKEYREINGRQLDGDGGEVLLKWREIRGINHFCVQVKPVDEAEFNLRVRQTEEADDVYEHPYAYRASRLAEKARTIVGQEIEQLLAESRSELRAA